GGLELGWRQLGWMPATSLIHRLRDPVQLRHVDQYERPVAPSLVPVTDRSPACFADNQKAGLLLQEIRQPLIHEEIEAAMHRAPLEQAGDAPRRSDAHAAWGHDPVVIG